MSDMTQSRDPEANLALQYVSEAARSGVQALFLLDTTLAQVLRTTREPIVGQMRLTWWHDALTALDTASPPAEPILRALAGDVVPQGITGARLAGMIDGWEELLDGEPLDDKAIMRHAGARGAALFAMAGALIGAGRDDPVARAGEGWALADLARHLSDPSAAGRALALAEAPLSEATGVRWSRAGRPLGALAHIARMNLAVPLDQPLPAGAPRRVGRLLFHRVTGR
ncbi:squalene/phytoene synthase family protein [Sphingomonas oligophenolica]